MKEKDFEENNLVEELIFDEDGNEIEKEKAIYDINGNEVAKISVTDEIEELTEETATIVSGGGSWSYKGTKSRSITLSYVGQSKYISPPLSGFWSNLCITSASRLISASWSAGMIKIKRKSSSKGTAIACYNEYHGSGNRNSYYYKVYVYVKCS